MAYRIELEQEIEAEKSQRESSGWGMDVDNVNKTITISNDRGVFKVIPLSSDDEKLDVLDLHRVLIEDTIGEISIRKRTDVPIDPKPEPDPRELG